jgi:hypothetical protein
MLRFLLILSLILFVAFKLGSFFFRIAAGASANRNPQQARNRNPQGGNVTIDRDPQQKNRNKDFEGGEYIDYEEVK